MQFSGNVFLALLFLTIFEALVIEYNIEYNVNSSLSPCSVNDAACGEFDLICGLTTVMFYEYGI